MKETSGKSLGKDKHILLERIGPEREKQFHPKRNAGSVKK